MQINKHVNEKWNAYKVLAGHGYLNDTRPVVLKVCVQVSCTSITWGLVKKCKLFRIRAQDSEGEHENYCVRHALSWWRRGRAGFARCVAQGTPETVVWALGAEPCRETYGECLHFLPSCPWGRTMVGGTHLSFLHSVCFLFLTLIVCFFVLLDFPNHGKLLLFDLCDKLIWEKARCFLSVTGWVSLILRSSEAHCGHISKPPLLFHFYPQ